MCFWAIGTLSICSYECSPSVSRADCIDFAYNSLSQFCYSTHKALFDRGMFLRWVLWTWLIFSLIATTRMLPLTRVLDLAGNQFDGEAVL